MLLPSRPRPCEDESLVGYMIRLASANGRFDPFAFSRQMGMPHSILEAAATMPFDLAAIAQAIGRPEADLRALSYWPRDCGRLTFGEVTLDRRWLTLHRRRACSECLAEAARHRAVWDLTVATVCPVHLVNLIEACPRCKAELRWTGPSIDMCFCGHKLADDAEAVRLVPADVRALLTVHAILGRLPEGQQVLAELPGKVVRLGADGILTLMLGLGWLADGGVGLPRAALIGRTETRLNRLLSLGHTIALGWPGSFHGLLERTRADAVRRSGRYGARKEFGPVLKWATSLDPTTSLHAFVGTEIARFARGCPDLFTRMNELRSERRDDLLTLHQASRRLGRSVVRVHGILAAHGLADKRETGGRGAPRPLARKAVDQVAGLQGHLLDGRALAFRLACGRKTLAALAQADVLPCATGVAAELAGGKVWDERDVTGFLVSVELRCVPCRMKADEATFPEALRFLRQSGFAPREAAAALLGPLHPARIALEERGLRRIMYDRAALVAAIRASRGGEAVSIPRAAIVLGLKQQVMYGLARSGHLRTVADESIRGQRVEPGELERFRLTYYVPGATDAGRGTVAKMLLAAGVVPVSGPSVDGARQYVFLKSNLSVLHASGNPLLSALLGRLDAA